jgi:ActR/RegA family two-component response regulator
MTQYRVAVVDDDPGVLDFLVECLCLRDFDACGYREAEKLLADVFDASVSLQSLPDLLMVDLQLQANRMQGMDLVRELTDRDVPSEILVISGALSGANLGEAVKMGAAKAISKPFSNLFDLVDTIETLAEIGRKRRLYRLAGGNRSGEIDLARLHRPVFLSYSNKDKRLATGLRRNLEANGISVWYAPDAIDIGEPWRNPIKQGIDDASVFVALITDNYLASGACMGELARFHKRAKLGSKQQPLILPVLAGLSEDGRRNNLCTSILEKYQCADISVRFIDGLTVLMGRIQAFLQQRVLAGLDSQEPSGAALKRRQPDRIVGRRVSKDSPRKRA